jgi:glutathione synthase/RimK-type ligase-like ATP-grasp enzyme
MVTSSDSLSVALLDPNFSADPIAEALLNRGLDVWRVGLTGRDPKHVSLGGRCKIASVDYKDSKSVANWADSEEIDTFIAGCTDASFSSMMRVNRILHGATKARHRPNLSALESKSQLRRFLASVEVRIPRELDFAESISNPGLEGFPIIVKPVDMYSGIGINFLGSSASIGLERAVQRAVSVSPSGAAVIEEWVSGPNYGFTACFQGGQVVTSVLVREFISSDWRVFASFLEVADEALSDAMVGIAQVIGRALHKSRGLLHIQFIASQTGPVVLEVVERMPGDLYSTLAESMMPDFVDFYVDGFLPEARERVPVSNKSGSDLLRFTLTAEEAEYLREEGESAFGWESGSSLRIRSTGIEGADRVVVFLNSSAGPSKEELVDTVVATLGKKVAPILS